MRRSTTSVPLVRASGRWSTTSGRGSSGPSVALDDAEARSRAALAEAGRFSEPKHHALLDLALAAVEREDGAAATDVAGPAGGACRTRRARWPGTSDSGSGCSRVGSRCSRVTRRGPLAAADWVRADARRRGSPRAAVQADVLAHLAHAARGRRRRRRARRDVRGARPVWLASRGGASAPAWSWPPGATTSGRRSTVSSGACSTAAAPTLAAPASGSSASSTRLGR